MSNVLLVAIAVAVILFVIVPLFVFFMRRNKRESIEAVSIRMRPITPNPLASPYIRTGNAEVDAKLRAKKDIYKTPLSHQGAPYPASGYNRDYGRSSDSSSDIVTPLAVGYMLGSASNAHAGETESRRDDSAAIVAGGGSFGGAGASSSYESSSSCSSSYDSSSSYSSYSSSYSSSDSGCSSSGGD